MEDLRARARHLYAVACRAADPGAALSRALEATPLPRPDPGGRLFVVDYVAIEGRSEPWLLEHVRATPAEFRAELEGAGFRFVREHEGLLAENFVFELERP